MWPTTTRTTSKCSDFRLFNDSRRLQLSPNSYKAENWAITWPLTAQFSTLSRERQILVIALCSALPALTEAPGCGGGRSSWLRFSEVCWEAEPLTSQTIRVDPDIVGIPPESGGALWRQPTAGFSPLLADSWSQECKSKCAIMTHMRIMTK